MKIKTELDYVYLEGKQAWEEFPRDWTSDSIKMVQTVDALKLKCIITRHIDDRNEVSGRRQTSEYKTLRMDRSL